MSSIENNLVSYIRKEKDSKSRFAVRFLLVSGADAWHNVITLLSAELPRLEPLSKRCSGPDVWPQLFAEDLRNLVSEHRGRQFWIVPLGEVVRFLPHKREIIGVLAELECNDATRMFVPLLEVGHIFEQEMNKLNRYRTGELPPPLPLKGNRDIRVEVTSFVIPHLDRPIVNGIQAYLEHWERGGSDSVSLVTNSRLASVNITGSFQSQVFSHPFDYLSAKRRLPKEFRVEWGLENQWLWLVEHWKEQETFSELVQKLLDLTKYHSKAIVNSWRDWSQDQQWLGWLWAKQMCKEDSYIGVILRNSDSVATFIDDLIQGGFDVLENEKMLLERRHLLERIGPIRYSETFWSTWESLPSSIDKLKLLMGTSKQERIEIAKLVRSLLQSKLDQNSWLPYLGSVFPDLFHYLTEFPFDDKLLNEYFYLYNRSKLMDAVSPQLLEFALRLAEQSEIWRFNTRESHLEHLRTPTGKVLWIDGLGLEWAGLIRRKLLDQTGVRVDLKVGRASLPTTTAFNSQRSSDDDVNHGLDQIAHAYDHAFPETLLKEIDIVMDIVKSVIDLLQRYQSVIVTSDHGLSRSTLHKTGAPREMPQDCQVRKWGRYAEMQKNVTTDATEFVGCIIDGPHIILACHGRFAGGWGPVKEIHGGATFEEALVPIFVVTKQAATEEKIIDPTEVKLLSSTVRLNVRGIGTVRVEIPTLVEELTLRIGNTRYPGQRLKESEWAFEIINLPPGNYRGTLECKETRICDLSFVTVRGMEEKDLGI